MFKNILLTIDRSFDPGNYENFRLNEFLLIVNTFLLFVTSLVLMEQFHWITMTHTTEHVIHIIELCFGVFFLIEFILRMYYMYIPEKKLFTLYPLIQLLVIVSLLAPTLFNLAFLRIVVSLKMLKLYHMRREGQRHIAENPHFVQQETMIEKAAHPLENAVEKVTGTAGKVVAAPVTKVAEKIKKS